MNVSGSRTRRVSGHDRYLHLHDLAAGLVLAVLTVLTLVTLAHPAFRIAVHSTSLDVAITMATLLFALGAAYFALGEFLLYGYVSSLYLCLAFSVFATAQVAIGLYPLLAHIRTASELPYGWGLERIAGGMFFVAATLGLKATIPIFRRLRLSLMGMAVALGLAVLVATWVFETTYGVASRPLETALQLAAAGLFAGAGVRFWLATKAYSRTWFIWLSMSLIVAAFSEIQFALQAPHPGVVQAGNLLWLMFFTGILLALAGERSQNYRRLRWQARELEALHALMRAPVIENVPALLQHVIRVVSETFGAEARLVLADREVPFREDRNEDPAAGAWLGQDIDRQMVVGIEGEASSRVALTVPLGIAGQYLGMLAVLSSSGAEFTMHDVRMLRAFGAQATVLLERSMLYEEVAAGAVLQERSWLAREIHDGLAQHLAFLKMRVAWLQRSNVIGPAELEDIEGVLETALIEARHAITTLRAIPRAASTIDAIADYAREFGQVSGIEIEMRVAESLPEVGPKVRGELLRICQEALNNVRKHARASVVEIEICPWEDGVRVRVQDNGTGFDASRTSEGHFGLEIMRERAESVGGSVDIDSRPDMGTSVRVWVPGLKAEKRRPGLVI